VFHVSQLKKGSPPEVHSELPQVDDAAPHHQVPEQVLQTRQVRRRHKTLEQALIQWSGLPASLATRENTVELKARFPRAPAWGQAALEGGRNVMSPSAHGPGTGLAQRPRCTRKGSQQYLATEWVA